MVTVTNYAILKNKKGETFIALELTGSVQLIQNSKGNFMAVVQKCRVPSNMTEEMAKMQVGTKIDGEIIRVECSPYEYLNKTTGEVMQLQHSYSYCPPGDIRQLVGETRIGELQTN